MARMARVASQASDHLKRTELIMQSADRKQTNLPIGLDGQIWDFLAVPIRHSWRLGLPKADTAMLGS